jgi:transposase
VSKARLVITAVVVEGRSVDQASASYGVARSWIYELLARCRAEGDAAVSRDPGGRTTSRQRSRRPPPS